MNPAFSCGRKMRERTHMSVVVMMQRGFVSGLCVAALLLVVLAGDFVVAEEVRCLPYVDEQPRWETAMIRPHRDAFLDCPLEEETYAAVVRSWLENRASDGQALKSLGLGRLVTYPWLSAALVEEAFSHPDWDAKRGRSLSGNINGLVASILSSEGIRAGLATPFRDSGYLVRAVVVEKVLVAPLGEVMADHPNANQLVPYDAQVWLVLALSP